MRTIDTKEVKDLLAEWDKKMADFDPQKDLEARVQNYRNWVKGMEKRGEEVPADQKEPTDLNPGPAMDPNRPGNCYASMIAPIEDVITSLPSARVSVFTICSSQTWCSSATSRWPSGAGRLPVSR